MQITKDKNNRKHQGMVAYVFSSSTRDTGAHGSEFEARLVYKANSRKSKATQRNPISKQNKHTERFKKIEHKKQGDRKRRKRETLDIYCPKYIVYCLKNKPKRAVEMQS